MPAYSGESLQLFQSTGAPASMPIATLYRIAGTGHLGLHVTSDPSFREYVVPPKVAADMQNAKAYTEFRHVRRLVNKLPASSRVTKLACNKTDPPDLVALRDGHPYGFEHVELTCAARRAAAAAASRLAQLLAARPSGTFDHLRGFSLAVHSRSSIHFREESPPGLEKKILEGLVDSLVTFRFDEALYEHYADDCDKTHALYDAGASAGTVNTGFDSDGYFARQSVSSGNIMVSVQPLAAAPDSTTYRQLGFGVTSAIAFHIDSADVGMWLIDIVKVKDLKLAKAATGHLNALCVFIGAPDRFGLIWPAEAHLTELVGEIAESSIKIKTCFLDQLYVYDWRERQLTDLSHFLEL